MAFISFQPKDHFNTTLWSGNSSTQAITGVGFQPDFFWGKNRSSTNNHQVLDSIRGANNILISSSNAQAVADSNILNSFDSDGYTLGNQDQLNDTGQTYVGWSWKGGGTASSNSNGSITSSVSANTTAGCSIVQYTGTGSVATVGHGLSAAPYMIIQKAKTGVTDDWLIYHKSITATDGLALNNTTAATDSDSYFNDVEPTSTVFTIGTNGKVNTNGATHLAYCFTPIKGYSAMGTYRGNGDADGTFVFTNHKPAFVMIKCTSQTGDWLIYDSKRSGYNGDNRLIYPNLSNAEEAGSAMPMDILSNGFKLRTTGNLVNGTSGGAGRSYIYWSVAEEPLVASTGDPATAR